MFELKPALKKSVWQLASYMGFALQACYRLVCVYTAGICRPKFVISLKRRGAGVYEKC